MMKIKLLVGALFFFALEIHAQNLLLAPQSADLEREGLQALSELGLTAPVGNPRFAIEAGLLKKYQSAWNDFDPSLTDLAQIQNPGKIVDHYTDQPSLLYRDMCTSAGITNKTDLKRYLTVLYQKFPRQVWGDGWTSIRLFAGPKPGEWAYYYQFAMYRSVLPNAAPAITGTGMERVVFDIDGKLLSDEVHLILNSGTANCKFD